MEEDLDELLEENPSLLDRVSILEDEVKLLKAALYALPTALEKEKLDVKKNMEEFKNLQNRLAEISSTTVQSSQKMEHLGKAVDVVKKETNSWLVIIIICFSIFFIISLFIRTA
ncbi:MAG: hypothetical protein HQM02_01515 [Magnetococcales bacterium]|nr:hypothetical protein [Magnetococcales bacterium]